MIKVLKKTYDFGLKNRTFENTSFLKFVSLMKFLTFDKKFQKFSMILHIHLTNNTKKLQKS